TVRHCSPCASRRPEPAALIRLAEGRKGAPGDRGCRRAGRRSCRRSARPLAARSQPPVRRRTAATLYAKQASCLAAPPAGDVMTGRAATLAAMALAIMAVVTARGRGATPRFVWNVSGSMPTGLYRVRPAPHPTITTLVVAYPPEPLAMWLADGRYL